VVLLRVAQESLTNAGKHAAAAQVTVRLHYEGEVVVLQVDDDGRGFDVGALRHGYGLDAMRARVQQLGGRLTIRSAPGKGTTVRTEIDA
jgi:signal transduction histidine kinase